MNDLDKKDLLELVSIIKSSANNIGSFSDNNTISWDMINLKVTKSELVGLADY